MEKAYKIHDTKSNELYVKVSSHYFKTSDAKEVYRKSLEGQEKDDSILIEIAKSGKNEVEAIVTFGVEEAEQFALTLLNLCNMIKR